MCAYPLSPAIGDSISALCARRMRELETDVAIAQRSAQRT
jgi:hypothetical protein